MEDKDVEELLRKSAESIDPGDFSVRYKAIKHKLKKHKEPTKKFNFRVLATASLSVILVALIVLPFTITGMHVPTPTPPPPERYSVDDLISTTVSESEFYAGLDSVEYEYAKLDMEYATNFHLIKTKSMIIKGGIVEYVDESDYPENYISIVFYDTTVDLHAEKYADYDLKYKVGDADIKYKLIESGDEYVYAAYASCKELIYLIDYISIKDDVFDLFKTLFT